LPGDGPACIVVTTPSILDVKNKPTRTEMTFDISQHLPASAPAPKAPFSGLAQYNFIGGHTDAANVPAEELAAAAAAVLTREGKSLAMYSLGGNPLGYGPFREFIARFLKAQAGMDCDPDQVLVTSGSLQALDLVFDLFLEKGDTIILEEVCYGGTLTRLQTRGVNYVGVELDDDGIRPESLEKVLQDLKAKGVRPKMLYTIPTVQNPSGTIMSEDRRRQILHIAEANDLLIFEDNCYAELIWKGQRPPAFRALDDSGRVIFCGSFSKTMAPALRVGYVVADWDVIGRLLALKTDAGSGSVEQMVLAEYASAHFEEHVAQLTETLKGKCEAIAAALEEQFGATAEFSAPDGGIFIWVTLPDEVDTTRLAEVAAAEGVAINPGREWTADAESGRHRLRLCFGNPSHEELRAGVARLAEICHREFGVPLRSGNVER
jgi:2-aminoadipate transaminase